MQTKVDNEHGGYGIKLYILTDDFYGWHHMLAHILLD